MNVTITKDIDKSIVKIEGRVDTTTAKEFEQAIQPLMSEPNPDIVLDCSEFTYISSSGLRVFFVAAKKRNSAQRKIGYQKLVSGYQGGVRDNGILLYIQYRIEVC